MMVNNNKMIKLNKIKNKIKIRIMINLKKKY